MITTILEHQLRGGSRIGLPELDAAAALPHRTDTKYLVTMNQLSEIIERLVTGHAVLAIDGMIAFGYRSTYFDTADLTCYHDHRQGRRRRWKTRIREYLDTGRTRLEIKLKDGRGATDKHVVLVTAPVDNPAGEAATFLARVLADRYQIGGPPRLAPTLTVSHDRFTLGDPTRGTRITIDTDLQMTTADRCGRLRPDVALIETKSAHGRSAADQILRHAGLRPNAVSKYCAGMALTHPDLPEQPWRPLLRRYFLTDPALAVAA